MPYIGNNHIAGDHTNNFKVLDDISSYTATFDGSATSVVDTTNNTIRVVEHRFIQGQRVTYTNGSGGNIGGLTTGTAYFVIFDGASTFKLATSASNAANSVAINLSSVGSGSSHTLNAAFDGVNTKFKLTHSSGTGARLNNATQVNVAINNVLQKPNQSASYTEGFIIEDNHKIAFKTAPTSQDIFWGSIIANTLTTFDISDHKIDTFTGDGSTTEFTLSHTPANNESLMVTINGVLQHPSNASTARAYTLIASIIQFTSAPGVGDEIQVRHLGFAGATTADVSGFYGRTGNVVLTSNDHITTGNINAGIVTATTFDGAFSSGVGGSNANFTGIVTAGVFKGGDFDGRNLNISGIATFAGNVSIGGTLTYEDVTNIDSVGIITARDGLKVLAGGANVVGVVTATTFKGDGDFVDIDVDGHTELDNVNIAGIVTVSSNGINAGILDLKTGNNIRLRFSSGGTAQFRGDTNPIASFDRGSANSTNVKWSYLGADRGLVSSISNEFRLTASGSIPMTFHANSAERLRIESSGAVHTGISTFQDIDVDGHTNLDNVNIAGVTTAAGNIRIANNAPSLIFDDQNHSVDYTFTAEANQFKLTDGTNGDRIIFSANGSASIVAPTFVMTGGAQVSSNLGVTGNLILSDIIYHDGDTDTRIRFPAADTITAETAGDERLRIDSGGRVKIGTTSNKPAADNEAGIVFGDNTAGTVKKGVASFCADGAAPLLLTRRVSDGNVLGIADDAGTKGLIRVTSNDLEITAIEELRLSTGAGHSERLRIHSDGTVEVNPGNTTSSGLLIIGKDGSGEAQLRFSNASSNTASIRLNSSEELGVFYGGSEKLRITNSGSVKLNPTVGSTPVTSGAVKRFDAGLDYWNGTAGSANAIKYAVHGAGDDNMYGIGISASLFELQSQVDIAFFAGGAGSGTGRRVERARISGSSGLFDVVGSARATNFYLRGNGSAPTADASIFRPADNCFGIATGSTERVRVTNDLVNIKGGNLHVGTDSATANFTDSNGGNTRHIEIGATGGGDALLTTHSSGYGIGYFGYEAGGDRLVIACDQGGGSNSIELITTAGTSTGGATDNLNGKTARFKIRGNGGFRAENTDSNEVHAISNYDHGNNTYSHRNGRTLTSNGTGWDGNESNDGADPILVLSVADRAGNSDIGDAYGIQLHSESQDDNDYGPLIGWTNRSNSGNYNTTYAAIVGQKTGEATDANWSAGALHFFTNKTGSGAYMNNVADLSIDSAGHVMMPRNSRFFAISNSGDTDTANGGTGKISNYMEAEYVDSNGDYDTSNGRFTAPVDGAYEFHFAALHRAMNNSGSGELTFYKNGSNLSQRSFGYSNIGSGGSTSDHQHLHIHGIFDLNAGDYIEVYVYAQSSGMDFYVNQGLAYFSGKLLG